MLIDNFKLEIFGSNVPAGPDFNGDGTADCCGCGRLVAEIVAGTNDPTYDMNGDGSVDTVDLQQWLVDAGNQEIGAPYLAGDANLDGVVDVSDFNVWNGNKFTYRPGWCAGDFNADGVVDVPDFNSWNGNKFTSSQPAAVPEPAACWLSFCCGLIVLVLSRRKA